MVNLLTGDFTYVLPLLNVPSPEGGYPIALAYHAGIAMDQEASWVGLGWNVNPGAINRFVNGYPDDYNKAEVSEFFYDEGETQTSNSFGVSYSAFGGPSVGVGFSWSSHQGLGGHVSIGVGFDVGEGNLGVSVSAGTNGASLGLGYTSQSGLSLGVSASTNGTVGINAGLSNNDAGFSVGASSDGSTTVAFSSGKGEDGTNSTATVGFNFSSEGVGLSISVSIAKQKGNKTLRSSGGIGIGPNMNFNTTISQGNYNINQSNNTIPLFIPTPIGVFNLSFGKQKIEYYASDLSSNYFSGYLHPENFNGRGIPNAMDIYEIPLLESHLFNKSYNFTQNNPIFPAYDKFNVQAQGLSGSINARLNENIPLTGISDRKWIRNSWRIGYSRSSLDVINTPQFYFDNEISSYLEIPKTLLHNSNFISNLDLNSTYVHVDEFGRKSTRYNINIKDINESVNNSQINHLKRTNHIEYYTNEEVLNNFRVVEEGLLLPIATGFDRSEFPSSGIGAYKITAADGKTYHYSLPVYNYEKVSRTFGMSSIHKGQPAYKAYLEKRELEPYATHWFLTAVTGPDFVDNGNGIADEGDLGYWVNFEYGLWDEAYVWQSPYGQEYHVDEEDPDVKLWVKGVKQQYFLDRIKTRTHTALFLKNEREDARSPYWQYWSVNHKQGTKPTGHNYDNRFTIPQHKTLRLDKIILVKNEYDIADKAIGGNGDAGSTEIKFPKEVFTDAVSFSKIRTANYSMKRNVFDWTDNWQAVKNHAIKVICFNHTNTGNFVLAKGTPHTGVSSEGRLTLNSVSFDGKQGASVMPPYNFKYINKINQNTYTYNRNDQDDWGYNFLKPEIWSLNEIETPNGAKILVNYESHKYKSVTNHDITLRSKDKTVGARDNSGYISFPTKSVFNLQVNDIINLDLSYSYNITLVSSSGTGPRKVTKYKYNHDKYKGEATVEQIIDKSQDSDIYTIKIRPIDNVITTEKEISKRGSGHFINQDKTRENYNNSNCVELKFNTSINDNLFYSGGGGIRVESIATTNNVNTYTSRYKYGKNDDGIGWVSYIPFAPESGKEVPHSFELPAPKPMYEYVKHESIDDSDELNGYTSYKFHVMNQSSRDKIKYGNIYELSLNRKDSIVTQENTRKVKSINVAEFEIKDNLNSIGQLLNVANFNSKGQLLNQVSNEYFHPNELPNNIGVTQQSYHSYKIAEYFPDRIRSLFNDNHWYINSTTRIKYPSLLKSSTEYKGGFSYTTRFNNFDEISGQAKEIYSFSSDGLEIKSVSEPAFRKYSTMGSKADDINNKNMLSQAASTFNYYRKSEAEPWKLSGAEIQTWKDWGQNIWRKHKGFVWSGAINNDGSYQYNETTDTFKWNENDTQITGWYKTSEVTRYNDWSKVIEVKDINDNYASTKMCDNASKVLTVSNAAYTEMYYSGAEYIVKDENGDNTEYFDGQVKSFGQLRRGNSHTGKYIVQVGVNQNAFEVKLPQNNDRTEPKGKFKISVWVRKGQENNAEIKVGTARVNFNANEQIPAGDWVLLNGYITIPTDETTVAITSTSGTIDLDDFRLHPVSSSMTSYVYNEWDELTFLIGANNLSSCFVYDAAGRLTTTLVEVIDDGAVTGGFKKVSQNSYNYKRNNQ